MRGDLRVTVVGTENPRPLRPGIVVATAGRRLGQQLEVRDGLRTVTHRGTDAIIAGVTTANDDDVFALSGDVIAVLKLGVEEGLGVELEVLHRKVDAVDIAAWGLESYRW